MTVGITNCSYVYMVNVPVEGLVPFADESERISDRFVDEAIAGQHFVRISSQVNVRMLVGSNGSSSRTGNQTDKPCK
jgi:hypothetical protein